VKNIHKISIGVTFVSFFFIIATVHADTGHISISRSALPESIPGVVTAVSNNDLTVYVQTGSTAAITNYTVQASNTKFQRSGVISSASGIQANDKVIVMGTVSGINVIAHTIFDGTLPLVRGPPTA
jgi:V8-like Glu-specific endopeptidase